ncbi:MAG: 16S rRNA (cytidine(1402)-2'-O)-methyltransferase [Rhodospirillales bacterium]
MTKISRRKPSGPPAGGKPAKDAAKNGPGDTPKDGASLTDLAPGLYVTAVPIGNLRDITLRALDILAAADVIACEDTRITIRLLAAHNIKTPMTSYHDHNTRSVLPRLIERLKKGARVAQVTDAGTPLISDPGYRLVNACREAGIAVHAAPGPSAVTAALAAAGLATDRFAFLGFIPTKAGDRLRWLRAALTREETVVAFESARRLPACLKAMAALAADRELAVCRELTKKFEEVRRAPIAELAAFYAEHGAPKGEIVLVIAPDALGAAGGPDDAALNAALDAALKEALETMRVSAAAAAVSGALGVPRRRAYARALMLSRAEDG